VNAPHLNPLLSDSPVIELPVPEGCKAELTLVLVIYRGLPVHRQPPIKVVIT